MQANDGGSAPIHLARNIKQLRESRGLTQDQLARISGMPRPTWANLESGSANPTLSVLTKAAAALQVSVEELIGPPRATCQLYPAASLRSRRRGDVTVRKLLPDSIESMDFDRMELPPGARMAGIPHRTGTREYLTCERGEIELNVSGETFRLRAGDVVVFRGDQRHSYANAGSRAAVGYSIVMIAPANDS